MSEPRVAWDEDKADANRSKHGVDFFEAVDVLQDPLAVTGLSAGRRQVRSA